MRPLISGQPETRGDGDCGQNLGLGSEHFCPFGNQGGAHGEARPKHQTAGQGAQQMHKDLNPIITGGELVDEARAQGAPRWEARQGQARLDKAQG